MALGYSFHSVGSYVTMCPLVPKLGAYQLRSVTLSSGLAKATWRNAKFGVTDNISELNDYIPRFEVSNVWNI